MLALVRTRWKGRFLSSLSHRRIWSKRHTMYVQSIWDKCRYKDLPQVDGQGPESVWWIRQRLTVPSHTGGADQQERGGKEVLRKGTACEKAWRYSRECQNDLLRGVENVPCEWNISWWGKTGSGVFKSGMWRPPQTLLLPLILTTPGALSVYLILVCT